MKHMEKYNKFIIVSCHGSLRSYITWKSDYRGPQNNKSSEQLAAASFFADALHRNLDKYRGTIKNWM